MGRIIGIDWVHRHSDFNKQPLLAEEELSENCHKNCSHLRKNCSRLDEGQHLDQLIVDVSGLRHQATALGRSVTAPGAAYRNLAHEPETLLRFSAKWERLLALL